jgi:hypothetical protein
VKRFSRKRFKTNLNSIKVYEKWIEQNPQFKDYSYTFFKKNLKKVIHLLVDATVENPQGFYIPKIGTICIKVLDIDYKCAKDFNMTVRPYGNKYPEGPSPIITIENPKRMKVAWVKDKSSVAELSLMGMEMSEGMRKNLGPRIKGREKFYPKIGVEVKSKCEEVKEKSLFNIA